MNEDYDEYAKLITSQSDQMFTMADIINEHANQKEKLIIQNKMLKEKFIIQIFIIITLIIVIIYIKKNQT
jgi:nitrogen regulatory protein PII-like uncharacterized protein